MVSISRSAFVFTSKSASARASECFPCRFCPTMMMGRSTSWRNVCAIHATMTREFWEAIAAGSEMSVSAPKRYAAHIVPTCRVIMSAMRSFLERRSRCTTLTFLRGLRNFLSSASDGGDFGSMLFIVLRPADQSICLCLHHVAVGTNEAPRPGGRGAFSSTQLHSYPCRDRDRALTALNDVDTERAGSFLGRDYRGAAGIHRALDSPAAGSKLCLVVINDALNRRVRGIGDRGARFARLRV